MGAMSVALASNAYGPFAGSWRRRVREQFGLDGPQREMTTIPIPREIGVKDEYDAALYLYTMRQDTALWLS